MCGRFKTFTFVGNEQNIFSFSTSYIRFGSFTVTKGSDHKWFISKLRKDERLIGNSFGFFFINNKYTYFEIWKPKLWNNFCLIHHKDEIQFFVNNVLVKSVKNEKINEKVTSSTFFV